MNWPVAEPANKVEWLVVTDLRCASLELIAAEAETVGNKAQAMVPSLRRLEPTEAIQFRGRRPRTTRNEAGPGPDSRRGDYFTLRTRSKSDSDKIEVLRNRFP